MYSLPVVVTLGLLLAAPVVAPESMHPDPLQRTLKVHGSAVVATFGPDGPERCSGLPVARYSPQTLAREFGEGFILVDAVRYEHLTPRGKHASVPVLAPAAGVPVTETGH